MPIDEIEVRGSSFSCVACNFKADDLRALLNRTIVAEEAFDLAEEKAGFHDMDCNGQMIRGWYSQVLPFEVEHLEEGSLIKTLCKKPESAEFWLMNGMAFFTGKPAAIKSACQALTYLCGFGLTPFEFELQQMVQLQDRLSMLKSIAFTNPKNCQVRKAKLTGRMENYTDCNVIDPINHGIDSVSGVIDGPLGPMTLTVSVKGKIRLTVRKNFLLNVDCLCWALGLIRDNQMPKVPQFPASAFRGPDGSAKEG